MTSASRHLRGVAVLVGFLIVGPSGARADIVLDVNQFTVQTLTSQTPGLNPFAQARFAAIAQLAVFEAVNAITGDYEPYLGSAVAPTATPIVAPFGASPEAAVIAAAHRVLVNYFAPTQAAKDALDAKRDEWLATVPDGLPKTNGIAVGIAAANALIAERVGDGSSPPIPYFPTPLRPGEWDLTPAPGCARDANGNPLGAALYHWQNVRPFGVVVPASGHWSVPYRPIAPPALTSNEYAKHYNEVKTVGAAGSTERPADRTLVARFYAVASPTHIFHTVARQLAAERGDSLSENARNLALLSMATNDSLVASFAAKYYYDYWRPITAIWGGAADDNVKTEADATFAPLISTPCFPSYPSNHASGSNAAAEALRRIYGAAGLRTAAGDPVAVAVTVPGIGLVTLAYTSLEQICDDIDDARVFGGIHFRFDQEAGVRLGREVATHIHKNNLQPVHGGQ